jgi:hypothetical protein
MQNRFALLAVLALATTPALVASDQDKQPKKGVTEGNDPVALMKMVDGFRTKLPLPKDFLENTGRGNHDEKGEPYTYSHLRAVALRLGVKSKTDCMILLTYLNDASVKVRLIAAFALENVVKAYPTGFSTSAAEKLDLEQHRSMVQAFVVGIDKLAK